MRYMHLSRFNIVKYVCKKRQYREANYLLSGWFNTLKNGIYIQKIFNSLKLGTCTQEDSINSLTTRVADLQLFVTCAKRPELQICNFFTINT